MKYVVILGDGMADFADAKGNTPLMEANKPYADALAAVSYAGMVQTVPEGMKPGSDVANLSVMGYDPSRYYTGRSPLEALSIGVKLDDGSVTYRCNLVTLSGEGDIRNKTMSDYSAGEITTEEARQLMQAVASEFNGSGLEFFAGVSYRHCLLRKSGELGAELTPPHDISGKCVKAYLPGGKYGAELLNITEKSYSLLKDHPVNLDRIKRGLNPANSVWFWGEGKKPRLDSFTEKFGLKGSAISAVDLIKGIAIGAGMKSIDVEGATGTIKTNFDGKAQAALEALKLYDYIYVHLEAPDECGHQGDRRGKTESIGLISEKVIRPVAEGLKARGEDFRLMFLPDHATPTDIKTHTGGAVPFFIYDSRVKLAGVCSYTEAECEKTGVFEPSGTSLTDTFLQLK